MNKNEIIYPNGLYPNGQGKKSKEKGFGTKSMAYSESAWSN